MPQFKNSTTAEEKHVCNYKRNSSVYFLHVATAPEAFSTQSLLPQALF